MRTLTIGGEPWFVGKDVAQVLGYEKPRNAIATHKQDDGGIQDFIVGPFDQTVKTENLPVMASIVGLAYDGGTPFQAEIYFINLARIVQVKFGVPFFDVYDPRFMDFGVPVAVRGTISFRIENYREFVKLHRLTSFDVNDFQMQIRDVVIRYIKDTVANAPAAHNIPVIQIESKTAMINDAVEYSIADRLKEDFGVIVSSVDIGAIEIDKHSDGYRQLMTITRDVVAATVQAGATAKIQDIHDRQRIESENLQQTLRIQRTEAQYAQRMRTRTENIGAYHIESQAEVGVAGAEDLGQMGATCAGSVDLGNSGGTGFNPAAMMAGMVMGGAVGQNIAGAMNNAMSSVNQPLQNGAVPPPIPSVAYHVAINGQAAGPFDMSTLKQMAQAGQLTSESLVWKAGMTNWVKAATVGEINTIFDNVPPAIPV